MSCKGRVKYGAKPQPVEVAPVRGLVVPESKYPVDVLDIVCLGVLEGKTIAEICKPAKMPSRPTVLKWLNQDQSFMDRYLDCQRVCALDDAAKMQWIADGNDKVQYQHPVENDEGETVIKTYEMPEDVPRSKLRVDTIKWRATKLMPKVFGDKVSQEHNITGDLADLIANASNKGHNLNSGD